MNPWTEFHEAEYAPIWQAFESRFHFRPSVRAEDWPGIAEPAPSITYAIGHIYELPREERAALEADLEAKLLAAFRALVGRDGGEGVVHALDWQHASFRFAPTVAEAASVPWAIPALPDGDYYIFLAPDLRWGIFGHPWEETMCVFGDELLRALAAAPPKLFTKPVRSRPG